MTEDTGGSAEAAWSEKKLRAFVSINTFKTFWLGSALFLAAFTLLSFGEHSVHARLAFGGLAVVLGCATLSYLIAWALAGKRAEWTRDAFIRRGETALWWASYAFAWLGAALFLFYSPATAALELIRHSLDANYVSPFTDLQLRLATGNMPIWAQAVFETARRFALPLCLLHYLNPNQPVPRNGLVSLGLVALTLFFALWTLDRVIPIMYIGMVYVSRLLRLRNNPLKDKWFYVAVVAILLVLVGMKNIQYGEYRAPDLAANSVITEFMGDNESPAVGQSGGETAAPESLNSPADLASYIALSGVERVVFSPVAMTLYAFDAYTERNFLHWSSTRVFSIFGIGRFVPSLEKGDTTKFNDAFPVTFLGDLWRNGGMTYMPVFGILAGLLMFGLDKAFFEYARLPTWQTLCIFGVIFWFYGNAINATMSLLTLGSLASLAFVLAAARLLSFRRGHRLPDEA